MKNLVYYKKNILLFSIFLSSCSFVNENNINKSPPIWVEDFVLSFQTWWKMFDDVQINIEDIETNDTNEYFLQQTTEEDIKQLIDILFE